MSKYFAYIHNNLFGNEWCKNRTDLSASKRQSSKDKIPSEIESEGFDIGSVKHCQHLPDKIKSKV